MMISGRVCHFHRKTLRLAREGRCVWCARSPAETDFPSRSRSSYCVACLTSRIKQRGQQHKLANAIWRTAA
jgi:hypothetical protein